MNFDTIAQYVNEHNEVSDEIWEFLEEQDIIPVEERTYLPDASADVYINDKDEILVHITSGDYHGMWSTTLKNAHNEDFDLGGNVVEIESDELAITYNYYSEDFDGEDEDE